MARLTIAGVTAYAAECGYGLDKKAGLYEISSFGKFITCKWRLTEVMEFIKNGDYLCGQSSPLPLPQAIVPDEIEECQDAIDFLFGLTDCEYLSEIDATEAIADVVPEPKHWIPSNEFPKQTAEQDRAIKCIRWEQAENELNYYFGKSLDEQEFVAPKQDEPEETPIEKQAPSVATVKCIYPECEPNCTRDCDATTAPARAFCACGMEFVSSCNCDFECQSEDENLTIYIEEKPKSTSIEEVLDWEHELSVGGRAAQAVYAAKMAEAYKVIDSPPVMQRYEVPLLEKCLAIQVESARDVFLRVESKIKPFLGIFPDRWLDGESMYHKLRYYYESRYYEMARGQWWQSWQPVWKCANKRDFNSLEFWQACDKFLDYLASGVPV